MKIKDEIIINIIQPDINTITDYIIEENICLMSKIPNFKGNIIFIPGETYEIIEFLKTNELEKTCNIYSCNIDILPLDNDLLSLENEKSFKEIYIDNNLTTISDLAHAFVKIESCFGKVKYKYIKGDNAKRFDNLVKLKEKVFNLKTDNEILGMIVLDRSVDYLTTLTSNYTYEGLLDEFFDINFNHIQIKKSIIDTKDKNKNKDKSGKPIAYNLNSPHNNLYPSIKCMNIKETVQFVTKVRDGFVSKFKELEKSNKHASTEEQLKEMTELKTIKDKFMNIKNSLEINENLINELLKKEHGEFEKYEQKLIAGDISNIHTFYDDLMSDKKDLNKLLNLMVIECLTQGGIKEYNIFKRNILNIYGFQNIILLKNLENLGWLKTKELTIKLGKSLHRRTVEDLELINFKYPEVIDNCAYVLNGLCPISLRLVQNVLEGK